MVIYIDVLVQELAKRRHLLNAERLFMNKNKGEQGVVDMENVAFIDAIMLYAERHGDRIDRETLERLSGEGLRSIVTSLGLGDRIFPEDLGVDPREIVLEEADARVFPDQSLRPYRHGATHEQS